MKIRIVVLALLLAVSAPRAAETTLNAVLYPEGKEIDLKFETTERAPKAVLKGSVRPQQGQSRIEISWKKLEPALLFGGDVNCWILWTVTPEGIAQSLGELPVREDRSGEASFSTPAKQFALMVTAEPLPAVRRPSDLVAFVSLPSEDKLSKNASFGFDGYRSIATKRDHESIAGLKYDDKTPVELQQARKAIEIMDRFEAEKYAQQPARDARVALGQADDAYQGRIGSKKDVPELSMRTVSLASAAVGSAITKMDAAKAQETEAARLAELAQKQKETETERAARVKTEAELANVEQQRQALQTDMQRVQAEKAQVEADRARIQRDRDALAQRLSGALGKVSATERTGRGLVVSLSGGILFPSGKATLKPEAKVSLAKLSGILLMIPNTHIQVEGHTDSTGSDEVNAKLSQERAAAVMDFMKSQGVEEARMKANGIGAAAPVASNDTPDGRAKNRRVEIVVPETEAAAVR